MGHECHGVKGRAESCDNPKSFEDERHCTESASRPSKSNSGKSQIGRHYGGHNGKRRKKKFKPKLSSDLSVSALSGDDDNANPNAMPMNSSAAVGDKANGRKASRQGRGNHDTASDPEKNGDKIKLEKKKKTGKHEEEVRSKSLPVQSHDAVNAGRKRQSRQAREGREHTPRSATVQPRPSRIDESASKNEVNIREDEDTKTARGIREAQFDNFASGTKKKVVSTKSSGRSSGRRARAESSYAHASREQRATEETFVQSLPHLREQRAAEETFGRSLPRLSLSPINLEGNHAAKKSDKHTQNKRNRRREQRAREKEAAMQSMPNIELSSTYLKMDSKIVKQRERGKRNKKTGSREQEGREEEEITQSMPNISLSSEELRKDVGSVKRRENATRRSCRQRVVEKEMVTRRLPDISLNSAALEEDSKQVKTRGKNAKQKKHRDRGERARARVEAFAQSPMLLDSVEFQEDNKAKKSSEKEINNKKQRIRKERVRARAESVVQSQPALSLNLAEQEDCKVNKRGKGTTTKKGRNLEEIARARSDAIVQSQSALSLDLTELEDDTELGPPVPFNTAEFEDDIVAKNISMSRKCPSKSAHDKGNDGRKKSNSEIFPPLANGTRAKSALSLRLLGKIQRRVANHNLPTPPATSASLNDDNHESNQEIEQFTLHVDSLATDDYGGVLEANVEVEIHELDEEEVEIHELNEEGEWWKRRLGFITFGTVLVVGVIGAIIGVSVTSANDSASVPCQPSLFSSRQLRSRSISAMTMQATANHPVTSPTLSNHHTRLAPVPTTNTPYMRKKSVGTPTEHPTLRREKRKLRGIMWYDSNANGVRDNNIAVSGMGEDVEYSHAVAGVHVKPVKCNHETGLAYDDSESIAKYNWILTDGPDDERPQIVPQNDQNGKFNFYLEELDLYYYVNVYAPEGFLFTHGICNDYEPGWECEYTTDASDSADDRHLNIIDKVSRRVQDSDDKAPDTAIGIQSGRSTSCVYVGYRNGSVQAPINFGIMQQSGRKVVQTISVVLVLKFDNLDDGTQFNSRQLSEVEDESAIGTVSAEVLESMINGQLEENGVELDSVNPKEVFALKGDASNFGNRFVDVAVVMDIKAHYSSPPEVDFDGVVEESINRDPSAIRDELKEYNRKCRAQVFEIESNSTDGAARPGKNPSQPFSVFSPACANDVLLPDYFETSLTEVGVRMVSDVESLKCDTESNSSFRKDIAPVGRSISFLLLTGICMYGM